MQVFDTPLGDLKLLHLSRFADSRGWFAETFNASAFAAAGLPATFVQDNHSASARGVLRGLHYQLTQPQGKLVRVLSGRIFDVAVDLRRASPTFGQWHSVDLTPVTPEGHIPLLWIPAGFAHGFLTLSESAEVLYKTTDFYHPAGERCILWNDPTLNIAWPIDQLHGAAITVSPKDAQGKPFAEADLPPIE